MFDLRDLEFLDIAGLRTILRADARGRSESYEVVVVRPRGMANRVFTLTRAGEHSASSTRSQPIYQPGMGRRRLLCLVVAGAVLLPAGPPATAASPFEWRGIVEGPYGRPWSAGERERMLEWMAGHGLNAYVHAPKDDLYGRTYWRAPYPAGEQAAFDREIASAARRRDRLDPEHLARPAG